jgi:Galactose oxidase, central domain
LALHFTTIRSKRMSSSSQKDLSVNHPPADGFASQSTQQPLPVCTWSAHVPQTGPSPSPFPRERYALTATATATGELFFFGGYVPPYSRRSRDLYVLSIRDLSTTLMHTSGEGPSPRAGHGAALIGAKLLICGGVMDPHDDSLFLLNLGMSDLFMSGPTPADHSFALQNRESGPALWSMVPDRAIFNTIPQLWSVPSSTSSVGAGILMICGHSI